MASTLASRVLGFVRIAVVGAIFGASGDADVLNVVFTIPNNLRKLLAEGALSSAFIPVMTQNRERRDLFRNLIGLQLVILVPLLLLCVLWAPGVVRLILDFPDPERQELAARLFRFLINYLLLVAIAAVCMGTLNANSVFLTPALAPLFFSVSVITSILLLHRSMGIFAMVVGVLTGGILQIVLQVPRIRKEGYGLLPAFAFLDPLFRTVMRRWGPVIATASIFTINQQIALFFASALPDGSGSALTNALVFWQLPFGVFSASVTTVLFPRMSAQSGVSDDLAVAGTVGQGLASLLLLLVPSGIGLVVLGDEIIAVALQRGAFTATNTALTARVLTGYAWGLFSVGAYTFLQRLFYALGDYRTPLVTTAIVVVLDVALSLYLKETRLQVAGLAWANTVAFTFGSVMLFTAARRRLQSLSPRSLIKPAAAAAAATGCAVAFVVLARFTLGTAGVTGWWLDGSSWRAFAILIGISFPALVSVVAVYALFGYRLRAIMQRRG